MSIQAVRAHLVHTPQARRSVGIGIAVVGLGLLAVGVTALAGRIKLGRWPAGVMVIGGSVALLGGLCCGCWRPRVVVEEVGLPPQPVPTTGIEHGEQRLTATQWIRDHGHPDLRLFQKMLRRAHRAVCAYEPNSMEASSFAQSLANHIADLYRDRGPTQSEATLLLLADVAACPELRRAFPVPLSGLRDLPVASRIFVRLDYMLDFRDLLSDRRWYEEPHWARLYWSVLGYALLRGVRGWGIDHHEDEARMRSFNALIKLPAPVDSTNEEASDALRDVFLGWAFASRTFASAALARRIALWFRNVEYECNERLPILREGLRKAMTQWREDDDHFADELQANETMAQLLTKTP